MKFLINLAMVSLFGWFAFPTWSQSVPELINYQGQIANQDGTPVPTGDYELTLSIYDAPTGGSVIWGPQKFNGTSGLGFGAKVPVVQGYFNLTLGPVDIQNRSISSAFGSGTRYVEIKIGTNQPVTPRQQFLSAPYALQSLNAIRASDSQKLAGYDWSAILIGGAKDPSTAAIDGSKIANSSLSADKLDSSLSNQLATLYGLAQDRIWKPYTTNIKEIVNKPADEAARWEFGIYRQGDFRKLSVSTWNSGWRVMTEPYMTGDTVAPTGDNPNTAVSGVFRLGGSFWIWDTYDVRDDPGVYHLYYFMDQGFAGPVTTGAGGNGLSGAERGGEGWIYRRLRQ